MRVKKTIFSLLFLLSSVCLAEPFRILVEADPRIQLFEIIHVLYEGEAGLEAMEPGSKRYARGILDFFKTHRRHLSVEAYETVRKAGLSPSEALMVLMGYATAYPEIRLNDRVENFYTLKAGGRRNLERFIESMPAFAQESGFEEFFREHEHPLSISMKKISEELPQIDYAGVLQEYSGLKAAGIYRLIPSSFQHANYIKQGHVPKIFTVWPVQGLMEGKPEVSRDSLALNIWHEMSHTVLDDLLMGHLKDLDRTSSCWKSMPPGRCQSGWVDCVQEHVANAAARRIWTWAGKNKKMTTRDRAFNPEDVRQEIELPYIDPILRALTQFEADRSRYADLEAFYPSFFGVFNGCAAGSGVDHSRNEVWLHSYGALARRDRRQALEVLDGFIKKYPQDFSLWIGRANLAFELGDTALALNSLRKSEKLKPTPFYQWQIALLYQNAGQYGRALKTFNKLIRASPSHALYHKDKGVLLFLMKKESQSADAFKQAIHFDPGLLSAYLSLATLHFQSRRYEQALALYDEALKQAPREGEEIYLPMIRQNRMEAASKLDSH